MGGRDKSGRDRGRAASRLAALIREHRRGRFNGLARHREASRPLPTTHRYAHLDADPLRRTVDTIGATILAAMDGGKGAVVPFKKSGT